MNWSSQTASTPSIRWRKTKTSSQHSMLWMLLFVEYHGMLKFLKGTKTDRKSTRLNSSHVKISYAVFCLKKKKKKKMQIIYQETTKYARVITVTNTNHS